MVEIIDFIFNNYFDLSKEEIEKYVKEIQDNFDYNNQELVKAYFSKLLYILMFTYEYNIKEDPVINTIFTGKINNFKIVGHAISEIDKRIFMDFFDDDLVNFTSMLDTLSLPDEQKIDLFNIALDDLINKHADKIIEFVLHDKTSKYLQCIDEKDKDVLIEAVNNSIPEIIDDSVVNYIIEHNEWSDYFILNLYESLSTVQYSDYTKQLIIDYYNKLGLKKLSNISIEECANILNQVVNNDCKITTWEMESIIRSIVREELNDPNFQVYFLYLGDDLGFEYCDYNAIAINLELVEQFANLHMLGDLVTIIEAIFHECEHIHQAKRIEQEIPETEVIEQLKELLIHDYYPPYYDNNYDDMLCEREARVVGYIKTRAFCLQNIDNSNRFFIREDYASIIKKDQELDLSKKQVFGQSISYQQVFDYLVLLKPGIVINNNLLQKEYNSDGTKKGIHKSIVKK